MTAQASATGRAGEPPQAAVGLSRRVVLRSPGGVAWVAAMAAVAFFATAQYCGRLYGDSYFDLYAGRYVAEHGIPERNVVTVVAHGQQWIDQQWLAQLIYYRAWQAGGYAAVVILSIVLVSAGMALLGMLMLRRGVTPLRMCAWTLAAFAVSYGYATPRAQSFGYLFVPLVLWLVLGDDRGSRPRPLVWLSIPLLAVWANVHGSALLGAGLVGLHAVWRGWRALRSRDVTGLALYLLLGAGAAISVICTPYGPGVLRYYSSLIGNPVLASYGGEWGPPNPAAPYSWGLFAVVIAVAVAVAVGYRRGARPRLDVAVFAVVTLGVALLAFRNAPWFGCAGCLLAADMLPGRPRLRTPTATFRRMLAAVLAAYAVVVAAGLALAPAGQYEAWTPGRALDAAARIAEHHPRLLVLADQWSASGLLWLHPALFDRVAFDARDEQYNTAELAAFFDFMDTSGPHWQRLLSGYNLVVISRQWHPRLADAMTRMSGWRVVYSDGAGVVLERAR